MTQADKLHETKAARIMIVGYPGSGKTGACSALANAGYKLRVLDFDNNLEPLLAFTDRDKLANIDIITFEDKLRSGNKYVEVAGLPKAFSDAMKALDRWKYTDPETGEEFDLGQSKEWGPDTVVVLDSLTAMGIASKRRAMAMMNKTPLNTTQACWGLAMADQEAFIERLTQASNRHHVIVTAHLKMVGPKDVTSNDDQITKDLKGKIADVVPTRLFPSALGVALPPFIGGHFPTLVLAETEFKHNKVRRVLRTQPRPELDLKVPALDIPDTLPLEDGLLTIFEALHIKGVNNG